MPNQFGGKKYGSWEEMTIIRSLDEYRDQRKSADTLDVDGILKKLLKVLTDDRPDGQTKEFSVASIDRHVYKLATSYGKEPHLQTRLSLFAHGSASLDLNKFPDGTFTAAEIEANKDIDA
ncbi:uncharacterized protein AB675_6744 [Cyphellophora attinorum]|uniref:Uncharacterized protein n=1 Tax=Cyphellophora attinorum TaxID=1664694 RepID=A0A0N1H8V5_9EURO|nr:uncharacterized protein AB675_6744 [Phialophora attinorum]KPI43584.1 hypothetical protein AB675_6744 [Phialophora attinorum]